MRNYSLKSIFLFTLVTLICSCTLKNKDAEYPAGITKSASTTNGNGNADGFSGAEGEGFSGIVKPTISKIIVSNQFDIQAGTKITLKGSDFLQGIKITISDVGCLTIKLYNSNTLTCTLTEQIADITTATVTAENISGGAVANGNPEIVLDPDVDGVDNEFDNCPTVSNPSQVDTDGDGNGDECQDTDGDGIQDVYDNCPNTPNADQLHSDDSFVNGLYYISEGDACNTADNDHDGIINVEDNCREIFNADQEDSDVDGSGDVCDNDLTAENIDISVDENGKGLATTQVSSYSHKNTPTRYILTSQGTKGTASINSNGEIKYQAYQGSCDGNFYSDRFDYKAFDSENRESNEGEVFVSLDSFCNIPLPVQ